MNANRIQQLKEHAETLYAEYKKFDAVSRAKAEQRPMTTEIALEAENARTYAGRCLSMYHGVMDAACILGIDIQPAIN